MKFEGALSQLISVGTLSVVAALIAMGGCSSRYREVNSGRDKSFIQSELNTFDAETAQIPGGEKFSQLSSDRSTLFYYTEGGINPDTLTLSQLGPVDSVLAADFYELSQSMNLAEIKSFRAFFLIRRSQGAEEGVLAIKAISISGQPKMVVFVADGASGGFGGGKYSLSMTNQETGKTIQVSTDDLKNGKDEIQQDIQLQLSDEFGNLGKISSLQGF